MDFELFAANPHLRQILGLIYKDILDFHMEAVKYFRKSCELPFIILFLPHHLLLLSVSLLTPFVSLEETVRSNMDRLRQENNPPRFKSEGA